MKIIRRVLMIVLLLVVLAVLILEAPTIARTSRATSSALGQLSAPLHEMLIRYASKGLAGIGLAIERDQPISDSRRHVPLLSLKELARRKARNVSSCATPTVVVGLVDTPVLPLFHNWYRSAQLAGVDNLLPVTLNVEAHHDLQEAGIESYLDRTLENFTKQASLHGTSEFNQKGRKKFSVTLEVLELGYAVLMSDVDLYFIRDPFPFLDCFDCDFEISQDDPKVPETVSVGFVYFRPTKKTLAFLRVLIKRLQREKKRWDQSTFQEMMWKGVAGIKQKVLDPRVFVTGGMFDNEQMGARLPFRETLYGDMMTLPERARASAVVFHNSWVNCPESKVCRLRELGIWLSDQPNRYYSDPQRKYISYEIQPLACKDTEEDILYTALYVAKLLNRTLIVPLFSCTMGTIVPDKHIHKIRPHLCTICEALYKQWREFLNVTQGNFREHAFLNNPLVPLSVKNSVSPLVTLKSDVKSPPKENFSDQNDQKLIKNLDAYRDYSVLRLDARPCGLSKL